MTECCTPREQDIKMLEPAENLLVSSVALIDKDGRILLSKRRKGTHQEETWELPGGKIEKNEAPQIALKRELEEELGIEVCTGCLLPLTFLSHRYDAFHLVMTVFSCRNWKGTPQGKEGQELSWVLPNKLSHYAMPEANAPLLPFLRTL